MPDLKQLVGPVTQKQALTRQVCQNLPYLGTLYSSKIVELLYLHFNLCELNQHLCLKVLVHTRTELFYGPLGFCPGLPG